MRVERPFRILPAVEPAVVEQLRGNHIMLVPHACETCGELTTRGVLCRDCEDRARFTSDELYPLGGDGGAE